MLVMVALAACGPTFREQAKEPGLLVSEGSTIYGCNAGQPTEVLRWNDSEFVVIDSPATAQLQRCEDALTRLEEQDSTASVQWRLDDNRVQRSSDGVSWDSVGGESEPLYEPTFLQTGRGGEIAVSHCRSEARRPDYYCYLEVSADDGGTWVTFPQVGVFVEGIGENGVLVGEPAIQPTDHTFTLRNFDGDTIVSIGAVAESARIHVMDDRIVVVELVDQGTSLELEQFLYP